MIKEGYQEIRARELNLPLGTGKRYSSEDLTNFIDAIEEIEGNKMVADLQRNVLIAFATPPTLAIMLNSLPQTEIPLVEAVKGVIFMTTLAEIGWVGGGVIIEGTKAIGKIVSRKIFTD